jgi:hypothetical protein
MNIWPMDGFIKGKCKAVPLEAWDGPEGSSKLRFPDVLTTAQDGAKVVSLTHRPHLPPGNTPSTHFCQRLSRPQGHSAIRRIYVNEEFQWHHLGSNQQPSDLLHSTLLMNLWVYFHEFMDELLDRWMDQRLDEWVDGWMNGSLVVVMWMNE